MKFDYFTIANGSSSCYIIAEIGVNHGGNVDLAKKMVLAAKRAGADAVKFQTFTARDLVTRPTPKVEYQKRTSPADESHYDMIRKLEMSHSAHRELFEFCSRQDIEFFSTPYDIGSAEFLRDLGVRLYKVASADIVDLPLHRFLASTGDPVIVSTGMASLGEIEAVVEIYREVGKPRLVLLHCVSNYPCTDQGLNLRVLATLRSAFDTPVGFSDHSDGPEAAVVAVALGARVIEKHFTLDRTMPGPDHAASSDPLQFSQLVQEVRRAELMLGSPVKACRAEERQMAQVSRKSIVLREPVKAGEVISAQDLTLKRPGTGLLARDMPLVVNRKAKRDLAADHLLTLDDVE